MSVSNYINTGLSTGSIRSLNNLQGIYTTLQRSLESLSTGYKFNSASEAPAASAEFSRLSSHIGNVQAAIDNNQESYATLGGVDTAQSSILKTLMEIRVQLQEAVDETSPDVRQALLGEVNSKLGAINNYTRSVQIGGDYVLSGEGGYDLSGGQSLLDTTKSTIRTSRQSQYINLNFDSANAAEQATVGDTYTKAALGAETVFEITTETGTQTVKLAAATDFTDGGIDATLQTINATLSGINAEAKVDTGTSQLYFVSDNYGDDETISYNWVYGDHILATDTLSDTGADGSININGKQFTLTDDLSVNYSDINMSAQFYFDGSKVGVDPVTGAPSDMQVSFEPEGGVLFQISDGTTDWDSVRYGFRDLSTDALGLDAIVDSTSESFMLNDPVAAMKLVDEAISLVRSEWSGLGSFMSDFLSSQETNLRGMIEALNEQKSAIADTDEAYETMRVTKLQVLQQANISALSAEGSYQNALAQLLPSIG